MKTRRFVRRALLAAAVTTTSIQFSSAALAFQAAQQGQSAPAGTVEQELQKLFNESGQPMPSMKQNELPNAQQPVPATVRPKPQTPPAKKNFLQKFVGKISGQEKKEAEAAIVPPVPPDYKEPAPAPPAGNLPSNVAQNRPNNTMAQPKTAQPKTAVPPVPANRQTSAAPAANAQIRNGQPQNRPVNNTPQATAQTPPQSAPQTAARPQTVPMQKGMPVPRTQPNASVVQKTPAGNSSPAAVNPQNQMRIASTVGAQNGNGNRTPVQAPVTAAPNAQPGQQKFVQPGSSPSFMPQVAPTPAPAAIPGAAVNPTNSVPKQVTQPAVPNDDFQDPFEGTETADPSDSLDLDALVIPAPAQSAPTAEPAEPAEPTASPAATPSAAAPAEPAPVKPFTEGEEEAPKPEENPFTGVRLNDDELEVFQQNQNEAAAETKSAEPRTAEKVVVPEFEEPKSIQLPLAEDGDMLGTPVPPVEDFDPNLPAIALPPVDEADTAPAGPATNPMLMVPDLDEMPAQKLPPAEGEATAPSELSTTPNAESKSDALMIPSAESPAPPKNVEAEKLQQAAEQDRRLRQQRLIQSRADRTGFKGFCPVALRDRRDLVDAQTEYSATFGLQTYQFSSAEAKAAFESDPSRYAPAAGGNDVVVLVNSGEEQSGMLDFALWYRDRLYLFRSRETMTLFNKDPQKYANQY